MIAPAALVTGGSGGIGLAIARALGEEGYRLTVCGRRRERLDRAAAGLRANGLEVQTVVADVAVDDDVLDLFATHRETYGRLDVLVNNAGTLIQGTIEEIESEDLGLQLETNLRALVLGTREGLPLLRKAAAERGKASIVNTASIAGKGGQAGAAVYSATKAAVINFTACTHAEVGAAGIQCTALAPGFVDTAMADPFRGEVPGEAMIRPSDVAEAVRFLLRTSPQCHVPEIVLERAGRVADGKGASL